MQFRAGDANSTLINGLGRSVATPTADLAVVNVTQGKRCVDNNIHTGFSVDILGTATGSAWCLCRATPTSLSALTATI